MFIPGATAYNVYLAVHLFTIICGFVMIVVTAVHKPSKGQGAVLLFLSSAMVYLLGFLLEIMARDVEGFYMACVVEYFGEALSIVASFYYVKVLCKLRITKSVYIAQAIISALIFYGVCSTRRNHFFYREMAVNYDGPFPHLALTYGPGFYLTIAYVGVLSIATFIIAFRYTLKANKAEKNRCYCTIMSLVCAWIPYILKLLGITGGYEIPGPGMFLAGFWLLLAMYKYGFLDSITLAGEQVIDNGSYAIIVMGNDYKLQYENKQMADIFGHIPYNTDIRTNDELRRILAGNFEPLHYGEKIYDVRMDELRENNYLQGYMILIFDNTDHYKAVEAIKELADKDPFTRLYNRVTYREQIEDLLMSGERGTFVMMDIDNFKNVNDRYGHKVGDEILLLLAQIINKFDEMDVISSRLGGDEFSLFIKGEFDDEHATKILTSIQYEFQKSLVQHSYTGYTDLSIGAINLKGAAESVDFDKVYARADLALYAVKNSGKGKFIIKGYKDE